MKINIFLLGFGIIFGLTNCDKEVDVVIPELFVTPTDAGVLDTVASVVYASATIDGESIQPDSYVWKITGPDGGNVEPISGEGDSIKWIPIKEGDYLIQVTVKAQSKSVTKASLTTFKNTIRTFQKALVGQWEGTANAPFFSYGPRIVRFTIEADGHYSAYIVSEQEPPSGTAFSVLANGVDEWDHPQKKIIVKNILSNGEATGTIKFVHYGGEVLTFLFDKMKFSNDYHELLFNSGHFEPQYLNIEYNLTRQN